MKRISVNKIALLFTLLLFIASCSKNKEDKGELLLGAWRIKSQVDIIGTTRGYIVYGQTNQKWLEFQSTGRVMCNGIVTPTWVFLPITNTASYYLKDDIINVGDSVMISGSIYYLNPPMKLKINFISKDLLVIQHVTRTDPAAPITIDSLVRN